ncbi:metallothionein-like protein type 2 [Gossypium raimondii]|uniref:Metallothionein-like protein n=1 Tax=Gossypium raimondii TaxID=29730 RepID=A0A0D2PKJ5_GOSRA|nr:metallothionein-like protein type 2 [Gossypium raimondii]KJB46587.1 hypothetical protein B456_007G376000 [Gossypium raimondii]
MSCCSGKCGCGADCHCGSGCNGCGMFPDIIEKTTTETIVLGVTTQKMHFEGSEMGVGVEGGCPCGDNCKCDPCTCGK